MKFSIISREVAVVHLSVFLATLFYAWKAELEGTTGGKSYTIIVHFIKMAPFNLEMLGHFIVMAY